MTVEIPSPDPVLRPKPPKKETRMYLPAVYRYSCLGGFSASSLQTGSTGNCRGVRSNLEHLLDMNPSTRTEAITNFTGEGVDVEDDVGLIEDGRPNPALIYPHAEEGKNPPAVEDDTKILLESWSAFGSTEVECLQLTDLKTGKTEIVAVSPYNAAIVSSRKIEMKDRTVSSTEFGIGPYKMQFLIETGVVRDDLEDHPALRKEKDDQTVKEKKNKASKEEDEEVIDPSSGAITPNTFENAQEFFASSGVFFGKMYNFSLKMVDKMQSNATWLYGNLQDDFPARTVASGRRIIDQMPKTAALLTKVIKQICGYDDDGDHK
uniref:Uncharacterized protein n=1 Tax=Amphora coffeiformis TaxID=265554 RepID=A0A6S8ITE0_9STRA|mmetsp:Transcript_2260/g.4482  ORF Transcript_2260/g.4482 Transcript_2260/m.4482 type:complete len:320 (-) Transcript_2260:928-1887(-)|eukprot:scaffold638_cov168-Amphora_coffeaeformis.AAC.20